MNGHAVCVKKHQGIWYLIDSENSKGPVDLDTADKGWEMLYRHIYKLDEEAPGDFHADYFKASHPHWQTTTDIDLTATQTDTNKRTAPQLEQEHQKKGPNTPPTAGHRMAHPLRSPSNNQGEKEKRRGH